jgi:RNA polymerase-binding transcription factor DksA
MTRSSTSSGIILNTQADNGANCRKHPIALWWKKNYRKLMALHARIEAERDHHALDVRQPLEPFSMDMADAASDDFDHDLTLSNLSTEHDALYEIEEALHRMANGNYGICELSHKPIPQARLNVLPWTRFTKEVQAGLERTDRNARPHLGQLRSVAGPEKKVSEQCLAIDIESEVAPTDELLYQTKEISNLSLPLRHRQKTARGDSRLRARRLKESKAGSRGPVRSREWKGRVRNPGKRGRWARIASS